ncbi:MAG: ankyrin repeat domain-containing protein [Verrucomicrobiota bacterium]
MHPNPFYPKRGLLLLTACLLLPALTATADEPALRELLRDGLYTEEVTRDPEAAAKQYEQLLARYSEQRDFAAAALFRLAEVRRKQDRKEDAVKLYQQLLAEFPGAVNETKLARENLAALGGKPVEAKTAESDYESDELARLESSAKSAPDILLDPMELRVASERGAAKVVEFLLKAGSRPYNGEALVTAAGKGYLDIVKMLTAGDSPPPAELAAGALAAAIRYDRYTVLDFLLEKGFKPGLVTETGIILPAISYALVFDKRQCAEILLKHGADLNVMSDSGDPSNQRQQLGSPLELVIEREKLDAANWLLEKGAKADIPDPNYGVTPLHHAAFSKTEGCLGLMEKLLSAGADANRVSSAKEAPGRDSALTGASPLATAVDSGYQVEEKLHLLFKHGARAQGQEERLRRSVQDEYEGKVGGVPRIIEILVEGGASIREMNLLPWAVSRGDLPLIASLLKHGGDPNGKDKNGDPLLAFACVKGNPELVKMLLGAGADPQITFSEGTNLIRLTAKNSNEDGAVECLKLLADAGLKPDAKWAESRYEGVRRKALRFLLDRFIIPELAEKEDVSLVMDQVGGVETVSMADGRGAGEPPSLEKWLLAQDPKLSFTTINGVPSKYQWFVWRKEGQGELTATEFNISGDQPLPELQWGDVVECRLVWTETGSYSWVTGLTPETRLSLRKRISFPVTVEIDGKNREMIMRGDRMIFDPTKDELPLDDVQGVVEMLWQTSDYPEVGNGMLGQVRMVIQTPSYIVISRKDWPDVRLKYGSSEAGRFQLEAGDRVKAEFSEEFLGSLVGFRKYVMTVKVDGYPFTRRYPIGENTRPGILVPTLIQTLVDLQVPRHTKWNQWAGRTTLDAAELSNAVEIFQGFTLLPHPDLSRIRIRRLEDGKEKVIEVDLAKAVSSMTAQTTPEEARKADVMLQGSDIVEISLKRDALSEPWKGFGDDESRFFTMALSGKVQMGDGTGNVTFSAIDWRPVKFIETEIGRLPVPEEGGMPSPRAWWLTHGMNGAITRGNITESSNASFVFLRDGDEFRAGQSLEAPRPPSPRQPRPRVRQPGSLPDLPDRIR